MALNAPFIVGRAPCVAYHNLGRIEDQLQRALPTNRFCSVWANHGANHRKCTTHDTNAGRQHRRPSCRHLRGRPRSPAQSYYDYLWKGDQHIISTSTTPPKDNHQKLASPHLRQQSSFYQIGYKPPNRELRPHLPPQGATVTITSPSTN